MTQLLPARVHVSTQVLFQELDGEAVLLDLANERYYGLNDVGTRAWQLLAEKGDVRSAYEQLRAEYQVAPETLQRDLAALIERLNQAGLVILSEE